MVGVSEQSMWWLDLTIILERTVREHLKTFRKVPGNMILQAERLDQVIIDDLQVSSSGIRHMIEEGQNYCCQ